MEKKKYIAPLTETSLMAIEQFLMKTSNEEWIDPSHGDAKENSEFIWDENPGDPFNEESNPFDLWGE